MGVISYKYTPLKLGGNINRLYVTSDFGVRGSGFHHGIDLVGYDGTLRKTDVIVPFAGTVTKNYWSDSVGWAVHIRHSNAVTRYYHLEKQSALKVGQSVAAGDYIAPMGNTGTTSNGNHLHFEVRNQSDSEAYNPKPYITGEKTVGVGVSTGSGFTARAYKNGSGREYTYSTTAEALSSKNSIGYLDPNQTATVIGRFSACPVVVYDAAGKTKIGFVKYEGGVKEQTYVYKTWQNGTTKEYVYDTVEACKAGKGSIGYLYPSEAAQCCGIINGVYAVVYNAGNAKKVGFVKYAGGVK